MGRICLLSRLFNHASLARALQTSISIGTLIGSIRRECLDHVVVFGERHLRNLMRSYQQYYNECRTHLSLDKDAPLSRPVTVHGRIAVSPVLGGLHHHYCRV